MPGPVTKQSLQQRLGKLAAQPRVLEDVIRYLLESRRKWIFVEPSPLTGAAGGPSLKATVAIHDADGTQLPFKDTGETVKVTVKKVSGPGTILTPQPITLSGIRVGELLRLKAEVEVSSTSGTTVLGFISGTPAGLDETAEISFTYS